jgi:hypothetical protein
MLRPGLGALRPKTSGQMHPNLGECEENTFEATESWRDRIMKTEQIGVFGFAEFSAL